jgi:rRNA processing protein Krr1/Pno1
LRDTNEDVTINILRKSGKLTLRGVPERVAEVKDTILGLDIVTKDRLLQGQELSIIIGKKGATIGELVRRHKVSIDLEKVGNDNDTGTAYITGPSSQVDEVLAETEELINENREVFENIYVNVVLKKILLHNSGKSMKNLQRRVNESLKEESDLTKCALKFDNSLLVVKAKQSIISAAMDLVKAELELYEGLFTDLEVDPFIVPTIIGRNGETVRKLTEDKPSFVEMRRNNGKIALGATSVEELEKLKGEILKLINNNSILRVSADPEMMKSQLRELGRSKTRNVLNKLQVRVDLESKTSSFILCGKKENLEQAKDAFEEYLINNCLDEMAVTGNDMVDLLAGGQGCLIQRLSNEMEANLRADNERKVVIIRGTKDTVVTAKKRLDQLLHGGYGHSVAKVSITANLVGPIIGKGGKYRQQLEQNYGVSVQISESQIVTIRGPEDKVAKCKLEVLKRVSTARIAQTLPISEQQQKSLERSGALKRIMRELPGTNINVANGIATVRGYLYDVRDALSLLNEQLSGEYRSCIELDAVQFSKVKATARDPSHFKRIETVTAATVSLDLEAGFIVVSGKRSNVQKAKDHVFEFLNFVLPGESHRLELSKPLHSSVGQALSLAEVAALAGGPTIYLDRDLSCIIIRSTDSKINKSAKNLLQVRLKEAEMLVFVLEVKSSDSWLLPLIVGKNGSRIALLEKESGCKVDVSKESRTITMTGESEEKVAKIRESLNEIIENARRENVFISVPEPAIGHFIGKGASHLRELSKEYGVDIQRVRKGPHQFKLSGKQSKIQAAQGAITEWLSSWEEMRVNIQMPVEKQYIPAIIGPKAETIKSIEEEFCCRVDIDRETLTITVRNGNKANRQGALDKIESIISKERDIKAEVSEQINKTEAALQASKIGRQEHGMSPINSSEKPQVEEKTIIKDFSAVPVGMRVNAAKEQKDKKAIVKGTEMGQSLLNLLISNPIATTEKPQGEKKAIIKEFPTVPVSMTMHVAKKQKDEKVVVEGTETGHFLFNILISKPVSTKC